MGFCSIRLLRPNPMWNTISQPVFVLCASWPPSVGPRADLAHSLSDALCHSSGRNRCLYSKVDCPLLGPKFDAHGDESCGYFLCERCSAASAKWPLILIVSSRAVCSELSASSCDTSSTCCFDVLCGVPVLLCSGSLTGASKRPLAKDADEAHPATMNRPVPSTGAAKALPMASSRRPTCICAASAAASPEECWTACSWSRALKLMVS